VAALPLSLVLPRWRFVCAGGNQELPECGVLYQEEYNVYVDGFLFDFVQLKICMFFLND